MGGFLSKSKPFHGILRSVRGSSSGVSMVLTGFLDHTILGLLTGMIFIFFVGILEGKSNLLKLVPSIADSFLEVGCFFLGKGLGIWILDVLYLKKKKQSLALPKSAVLGAGLGTTLKA